jgi:cobalt/nickel transport system permease protein
MHIPDGFLDTKTWVGTSILSVGALSYSMKKTREILSDRQVPLMGIMAAFIFAAQMVNFPVAGGTSGHLLGAALAAILLGPWSAGLIIATVVIVQCFFFQDGGLTALGANILNMAILGPLVAYLVYQILTKFFSGNFGKTTGIFISAWASVMVAALAATVELAVSGTVPFAIVFPVMMGWHLLIGIGEGIITVVVVSFVFRAGMVPVPDPGPVKRLG